MRIATSTIFDVQTNQIDNLTVQQQQLGNEATTGKAVTKPSDDPTEIAQDLNVTTAIAQGNQTSTNISNATSELTTVDGSLSTLSNILQSARSIAVEGASDTVDASQRQALGDQIDSLLQEAIGLANTQYAGKSVYAGTAATGAPAVTAIGQPVSAVKFNGNFSSQVQQFTGGQSIQTSVSVQQAFNVANPNGSPDVFQTLITLRDTLEKGTIADDSSAAINKAGTVITAATALNSANFATPIVPDSSGNISINIASQQAPNGVTLTFAPGSTITNVLAAINGSGTGVTATFNPQTERISLTSTTPFQIQDTPSPGAANTSNFVAAFNIQSQADLVNNVSRQIGDVDNVLQGVVNARAFLGGNLQSLSALGTTTSSQVVNNTAVQSRIEDADIAKVVSQFSQAQTALQAAFSTTSRLESKSLFDFLQ